MIKRVFTFNATECGDLSYLYDLHNYLRDIGKLNIGLDELQVFLEKYGARKSKSLGISRSTVLDPITRDKDADAMLNFAEWLSEQYVDC